MAKRKEHQATMTRDEVEDRLARGEHVGTAGGAVLRKGHNVAAAFPAGEDGRPADEIEAVVVRDEHGRLTRAGMEYALKAGGSVLWDGEVYTDLDKLPDEVELARGNEKAKSALAASLDRQMAALAQQRARLDDDDDEPAAPRRPAPRRPAADKPDDPKE